MSSLIRGRHSCTSVLTLHHETRAPIQYTNALHLGKVLWNGRYVYSTSHFASTCLDEESTWPVSRWELWFRVLYPLLLQHTLSKINLSLFIYLSISPLWFRVLYPLLLQHTLSKISLYLKSTAGCVKTVPSVYTLKWTLSIYPTVDR